MSTDTAGESSTDTPDAYDRVVSQYRQVTYLQDAGRLLGWDQQVTMPEGGTPARSKQSAALSTVAHEKLTDPELGDALAEAEAADLSAEQASTIREIRRQYDRNAEVPDELIEDLSETRTNAQQTWEEAKSNDDFDHFAPTLEDLRDLHIRRAEAIDAEKGPYEVMFEDAEPHLPMERMDEIFEELKDGLVPLIDRIQEDGDELPSPFVDAGPYPEEDQQALSEAVLDLLNYPEENGRLDTAPHPFTSGTQFDSRVTTRYKPDDPIDALTATIHEFGHASYQLGLSKDHYGEPLGEAMHSGVHESQSRFWENHVGRTREFWEQFLPEMKRHLDGIDDVSVEEAYQAVNRIYPDNLIRVEADELTYHLHIILRSEVGEAFVSGDIDVEEIPEVWNQKMDEYLGVVPETDTNGCLQDIHWSGRFAAFQGYTIGSVLAAQLDHAMRQDVENVDEKIRNGNLQPLWDWMTENVHGHGRQYSTDELVEEATGEPLTAEYFLDYVEEKFGELYGL